MNVCVFCGSSSGENPIFKETAVELGGLLTSLQATLIYGGGNIGLMGVVADEMLKGGSEVIGIIPDFLLKKEVGHTQVTRLEVVASMHERKRRMADLADCFLALPGGWGTLDELAEILTWKQLGLIKQPVGLLNVAFFFDPLISQMRHMVASGFLRQANLDQLIVENSPKKLLTSMGVVAV
ncbi:MAG: TIGR00730 family Rossman fold protein [Cyclobacteriaceae bacterium]